MRYENTKTGAVIDSPFLIKGELWVPIDNPNQEVTDLSEQELRALVLEQQTKIDELEATIEELNKSLEVAAESINETDVPQEDDEDEIDLQTLTNKQLEDLAKEQGIELTTADKKNKNTLIAAIVAALD